jgi:hypothetical protein
VTGTSPRRLTATFAESALSAANRERTPAGGRRPMVGLRLEGDGIPLRMKLMGHELEPFRPPQLRDGFMRRGISSPPRKHPPSIALRSDRLADYRLEFGSGLIEVVVDDAVIEVVLRAQLLLGDLKAFVDRLGRVGAASVESLT